MSAAGPDWPPVTSAEARAVLAAFGRLQPQRAKVSWHSARPLSAAAIVEAGGERALIKRHDPRVRTPAALALEHRFAAHLNRGGVRAVRALATPAGATVVSLAGHVYELQALADGIDLYRDAPSWTRYRSTAHARAAGTALARLHTAADSFAAPARPLGPLADGLRFAAAGEDGAAAARALARLPRAWGHGDWHPSNLTWSDAREQATVVTVLDLGLANRTTPLWDLAIAIERSCIDWLERGTVDLAALDALLAGYASRRPLAAPQTDALAALLPAVYTAYARSEVIYYGAVLRSPQRARTADEHLVNHRRWFRSPDGVALLDRLRARTWPPASPVTPTPRR